MLSSVSTSVCDVNVLCVFINWRKIVLREVKFVKLQRKWKFLGFCSSVAEVFVGLPWDSIRSVDGRTDMPFLGFA